jgi:serine/threonine-protein kinase
VTVRFGRYETLSPIASGGMASVHLGRALGVGGFERLVAIKVMHPDIAQDPGFVAMFLDEGRLAAQIRHPNVVGTLDVQEAPSGLFLVMEYVEGPSLSAIVRACRKRAEEVPIGVALRIVVDALLGLHAAHEQKDASGEPLHIVHRDVSPQNILVSVDGNAKITDFGVAHAEARLATTKGSNVKGKLGYMPAEQVQGEKLDRRADVYAAGVVLWELLTGERLFRGDNEGVVLFAVLAGAKRSPRDVAPHVPEAIDRVVMSALAVDITMRPPTALAFAEALENAAAEAGVTIASARALAAFVRELGAHKPPVTNVSPQPLELPSPSPRAQSLTPSEAPTAVAPQLELRPDAEGNSQVASVVTALPPRTGRARVGALFVALGLGGAAALGVSLISRTNTTSPDSVAAPLASVEPPPSSLAATSSAPVAISVAPSASAPAASASAAGTTRPVARPAAPAKPRATADWRPNGL